MIFVTVGTHEQPFNRLIKEMDSLKKEGIITEEVIIQTGYSTYEPRYCKYEKLFSFDKMHSLVENARIVITHGGPSSFIMPLQIGKIPVVVPRQQKFHEHVNNHQLNFADAVKERYGNIIVVENIKDLKSIIENYDQIVKNMNAKVLSNNKHFCEQFEIEVNKLMKK